MGIINLFVKNETPYLGKLKLKFEKNPNYENTKNGILNKVHINFGFVKFTTRLIPNLDEDGWKLKEDSIPLIEKYTSCLVGKKWVNDDSFSSGYRSSYYLYIKNSGYVCDLEKGWWMYKNNIKIFEKYPQCVGLKYDGKNFKSCYVFCYEKSFFLEIGDKIFEQNYKPSKIFHDKTKWKKWFGDYKKDFKNSNKERKIQIKKVGMKNYIPIQERGRYPIKDMDDAIKSVENILIYLSNRKDESKIRF